MMKFLWLTCFVGVLMSCSPHSEGYVIQGVVSDVQDSTMLYLAKNNEDFDSTLVVGNRFSFSGKIAEDYVQMVIHSKDYKLFRPLWVVNSHITIDATNSTFGKATISGSRIQDQSNEYEAFIAPYRHQIDSFMTIVRKLDSDSTRDQLKPVYDSLKGVENKAGRNFIAMHPNYELSAFFLTFYKNEAPKDSTKVLFEHFAPHVKQTEWGKTIAVFLEKSKKFEVGDKATDFSLPTLANKTVNLSDFKGKYVLLEFWATWCGPCRRENPILRNAYSRFKDQGFEILGVNLDEKKDHWESTVREDSITWTTVGDLTGMNGEVPITYSIYYIPHNLLLDKNGVVVAKDLRGNALQNELEKIFGS
ncbi:AhpC/TSA family protein [Marinoscillum furvescens]|nr:AhpC/TSA family protein [Marinoscillum furvescens]